MGHWLLMSTILRELIMQLGYHYQKHLCSMVLQHPLLYKSYSETLNLALHIYQIFTLTVQRCHCCISHSLEVNMHILRL